MAQDHDDPSLNSRYEAFERWLLVDKGVAESTARMRANIVRRFLDGWGTLRPTKDLVQQAKEDYVMDGYDKGYVRNICIAFKDYGEFIGEDLGVKLPPAENNKMPRFLTEQEVQDFLFVIDSIRDRALFTLLAYSGLRVGELVEVRREDLDFQEKRLMVRNGKGGKDAEIPVADRALNAVSNYLRSGLRDDESPYLFPSPDGGSLSTNRVRVLCRRYADEADIEKDVSPHMFRHALATNLLAQGCPMPFVQRQLRHSKIETTMKYLHLSDKMLERNYRNFLPEY